MLPLHRKNERTREILASPGGGGHNPSSFYHKVPATAESVLTVAQHAAAAWTAADQERGPGEASGPALGMLMTGAFSCSCTCTRPPPGVSSQAVIRAEAKASTPKEDSSQVTKNQHLRHKTRSKK